MDKQNRKENKWKLRRKNIKRVECRLKIIWNVSLVLIDQNT